MPPTSANGSAPAMTTQSQLTLTSSNNDVERFRNPPWWNRRSRLERMLCGVSVLMVLLLTGTSVSLAVVGYRLQQQSQEQSQIRELPEPLIPTPDRLVHPIDGDTPKPDVEEEDNRKYCLTPGCVKTAATLLNNLDETVNPCDDFYKFACGGWVEKQVIPEDKSAVSVFSELQDDLNNRLRAMVEKTSPDEEPDFVVMLKNMYSSCMDLSKLEERGSQPLQSVLDSLGGWPVVQGDEWNATAFHWMETLFKFRELGYSHDILLDVSVTPDARNNSRHIVDLDQTSLGMPDRSYLVRGMNDSSVQAYYRLMVESAVLLGAERPRAEREMQETLEFEMTLANLSLPREERRNISRLYNKMSLRELGEIAPEIDWTAYLSGLLVDPITDEEEIIVNVPDFAKNFATLITNTDKKLVANYMMWRLVGQSLSMLHKPWRDLAQQYSAVITGKLREEPRWEQCMASLTGSLGISLASLYVRSHFQEESKESALEMVDYIHKEFLKILEEITWMDEKTKQKAKDKAESIKPYIGYPDELLNNTLVSNLYKNLTVTSDDYFTNVQRIRRWSTDYAFRQLRKPNEKGDWRKHARAAVVNAYYNALENSIEFPAGILQGSFFSKDRPNYMNYGAIGFVIGHEITHGFDDRGRQFDKDGNNVNWWDTDTDQRFREMADCIIRQYSNYTVPENGLKVNGINTQGENIADNGGLKEAFRAYKSWVVDHGEEHALPGLRYTPNQLFWISAANVWCGKHRPEVLKLRILSGAHSPSQFRVIGPVSNLEDFSKEFNCPLGSPMNPHTKCTVW